MDYAKILQNFDFNTMNKVIVMLNPPKNNKDYYIYFTYQINRKIILCYYSKKAI